MSPAAIKRKYQKRILGILNAIAEDLREEGYEPEEPLDMECDGYSWMMAVDVSGTKVDISLKICESEHYDDSKYGVNFSVDLVTEEGRILGGLTPYNYSDNCWVSRKDADAIEARFRIIEQAKVGEIAALLKKI